MKKQIQHGFNPPASIVSDFFKVTAHKLRSKKNGRTQKVTETDKNHQIFFKDLFINLFEWGRGRESL